MSVSTMTRSFCAARLATDRREDDDEDQRRRGVSWRWSLASGQARGEVTQEVLAPAAHAPRARMHAFGGGGRRDRQSTSWVHGGLATGPLDRRRDGGERARLAVEAGMVAANRHTATLWRPAGRSGIAARRPRAWPTAGMRPSMIIRADCARGHAGGHRQRELDDAEGFDLVGRGREAVEDRLAAIPEANEPPAPSRLRRVVWGCRGADSRPTGCRPS